MDRYGFMKENAMGVEKTNSDGKGNSGSYQTTSTRKQWVFNHEQEPTKHREGKIYISGKIPLKLWSLKINSEDRGKRKGGSEECS